MNLTTLECKSYSVSILNDSLELILIDISFTKRRKHKRGDPTLEIFGKRFIGTNSERIQTRFINEDSLRVNL